MRSETGTTLFRSNSIENNMTTASSSTFVFNEDFLPCRVIEETISSQPRPRALKAESDQIERVIEETTSSRPRPFEIYIKQVKRANVIRSICGKYSFVQTSSDEFAKRKQIEIAMEG